MIIPYSVLTKTSNCGENFNHSDNKCGRSRPRQHARDESECHRFRSVTLVTRLRSFVRGSATLLLFSRTRTRIQSHIYAHTANNVVVTEGGYA